MAQERKAVTVHYRKYAGSTTRPKTSLERMLKEAFNAQYAGHRVKDRYASRVQTEGTNNYFVNIYSESSSDGTGLAFGDVIHFTKGHLQALLSTTNDKAATLPVRQLPAPAQNEYVHSQMFWMVKDDHVFIIQSMSLRSADLESYFGWLLKSRLPVAMPEQVVLNARFDSAVVGGDLSDIQEIIVGGVASAVPLDAAVAVGGPSELEPLTREVTAVGEVGQTRSASWAKAKEILQALLGGDAKVADDVLKAVPAEAELRVEVHIGYKTKKRQPIDRSGLRQLETGLRNLADSELTVKGKNGTKASDGRVRLHHEASVLLVKLQDGDTQIIGSLLDPTDVLRAMYEAYTTMLANGKLAA